MIPTMKTVLAVLSAVVSAGSIAANKYTNSVFKLTVDAPNATLKLNPLVNVPGGEHV